MNVTEVRDASETDRPLSEGSTVRLAPGALVGCTYGLRGVCTKFGTRPDGAADHPPRRAAASQGGGSSGAADDLVTLEAVAA